MKAMSELTARPGGVAGRERRGREEGRQTACATRGSRRRRTAVPGSRWPDVRQRSHRRDRAGGSGRTRRPPPPWPGWCPTVRLARPVRPRPDERSGDARRGSGVGERPRVEHDRRAGHEGEQQTHRRDHGDDQGQLADRCVDAGPGESDDEGAAVGSSLCLHAIRRRPFSSPCERTRTVGGRPSVFTRGDRGSVLRQHPTRVPHEVTQQLELRRGQRDLVLAAPDFATVLVEREVTDAQHGLGGHRCDTRPAQQRAQPGHDLLEAERLGHVVVAAAVRPAIVGHGVRAVKNNTGSPGDTVRNRRRTSGPSASGSMPVEHGDVGPELPHAAQRGGSGTGVGHVPALVPQRHPEQVGEADRVVELPAAGASASRERASRERAAPARPARPAPPGPGNDEDHRGSRGGSSTGWFPRSRGRGCRRHDRLRARPSRAARRWSAAAPSTPAEVTGKRQETSAEEDTEL